VWSNPLTFLAGALVASILLSLLVWLRHRKPTSMEAGIDAFNRELQALAPQRALDDQRVGGRRRAEGRDRSG
jgi:hypothetical protein